MNIRMMAALIAADQELDDIARQLKRRNDWRMASRLGHARGALSKLLTQEQEDLSRSFAEYLEPANRGGRDS